MLILALDPNNTLQDSFFPNHTIQRFPYEVNHDHNSIRDLVNNCDMIVSCGTTPYVYDYLTSDYPNYGRIESYDRLAFDYGRNLRKPFIGMNRGMILGCSKIGFDFNNEKDQDIHLNIFAGKVYGVNSLHNFYINSYTHPDFTYDVTTLSGKIESIFHIPKNTLLVSWNPELPSCPQSGIDLFDLLIKKYYRMIR